jgi:uncharacterized protein
MLRKMEVLSTEEARVLGCLIEKEATTPDAYPLTMNALVAACNQTSNRTPVVRYTESTVNDALVQLRERKLARLVHSSHGSRVTKHRHALSEVWAITQEELAVLAVLLLRGPQTVNELRTRTERYGADIDDLGGVPGVLDRLAGRDEPLAACLGRQPGQREERWVQLLASEPARATERLDVDTFPVRSWPTPPSASTSDGLVEEVRSLRREVDELRRDVDRLLGRD